MVDTALGFHRCKCIDKLFLEFNYIGKYKGSIDKWLEFATQKQVKSIFLNFKFRHFRARAPQIAYTLPKTVYRNMSLVEFVISYCDFPMVDKIRWNSLKLLSLTRTSLNPKLFSMILGGCSVLETLELRHCSGFHKIDSSSLKVLRIVGEQPATVGDDRMLEISGPNLVSLEVLGTLYRTELRLTDLGTLVNAVMNFAILPQESRSGSKVAWMSPRDEEIARHVLQSLCLVKVVTFGASIFKALSVLATYNLSPPWSKRRSLSLNIPYIEWSHLGIASLLRSSPNLESLAIKLSHCSDACVLEHAKPPCERYCTSWSTISKCPLLHLKTVNVAGFQVSCRSMKPLFEFLEFLLRNSKVLEEIVIQASREALGEAMNLLSVRTASSDVVVRLEPPHLRVDPLAFHVEDYVTRVQLSSLCSNM